MLFKISEVGRPALPIANRVQLEPKLMQADPLEPVTRELYHFDIKRRAWAADRLDVKLEKLAIPSLLWAVVPKHWSQQIESRRLGTLVQAVLEVRPHHAGGGLWSQCDLPAVAGREPVHLLHAPIAVFARSLDP